MVELAEWSDFYVIVGAAAGGLIGLQFVAMTLIADRPPTDATETGAAETGAAFLTPTIVHFGATLLLSALICAPWHAIIPVAAIWGLMGICGVGYSMLVVRRIQRARIIYQPVFEDGLFHVILPLAAYTILVLSAFLALHQVQIALFGVGAAALLLLFTGIHNAWDGVSYTVLTNRRNQPVQPEADSE